MRLAFVGGEQEWQQLRPWLAHDHSLLAVLPDPAHPPWTHWPGLAERVDDIEDILASRGLDLLLIAGPISARRDRLRRAVQAGRHCLTLLPADLAAITYHELAMVAEDTRATLTPFLPGRFHPAWLKLKSLCSSGLLGDLDTVQIERVGPAPLGRELLMGCYAEAADLLGKLLGELVELTATGDLAAGRLTVQHRSSLGTTGEIHVRGLRAGLGEHGLAIPGSPRTELPVDAAALAHPALRYWSMLVAGRSGQVEMQCSLDFRGSARLRWSVSGQAQEESIAAPEPNSDFWEQLRRSVSGQPHTPDWQDAVRAAELADWAQLSLERRRSVDVYHETRSELASFKGTMTSCGCGLIWFTLLMLLAVAAGMGLGIPGMRWVVIAVAALWIGFLLLQSLRWVVLGKEEV